MTFYLPFLIALMILAVIFRQSAVLTVFYLLFGVYFGANWWSGHTLRAVAARRTFQNRTFLNQKIPVELELKNTSRLPVAWLQVHEALPLALIAPPFLQTAVTILPRSSATLRYELSARRRGYYTLGPLRLLTGDLLGLTPEQETGGPEDNLTVYPQIVPMPAFNLWSRSPFGELRSTNPVFEDTNRPQGKRDYVIGDSPRRVDWKTSAALGRLQVKTFQPSMSLDTMLCLDMDPADYDPHLRFDLMEVAVIAAASTANRVIQQKQAVGLITNGSDPLEELDAFRRLSSGKGSGSLMSILDVLARVESGPERPFLPLVRREMARLAWGSTLVLITGNYPPELDETIFQARRMGFSAALLLVGLQPNLAAIQQRARRYHFRVWNIRHQDELETLT